MLRVTNLTKELGGKVLFRDINFLLGNKEKVGLIGKNGTGKTTLFNMILKNEPITDGEIVLANERVGYLPQELGLPVEEMVGEYIEDVTAKERDTWRFNAIMGKLELYPDEYQVIRTLSGGEKMRLKLAEVLYHNPTLLLLDEPTNHLDIVGIEWLKVFIRGFNGIILMISHDRDLLNSTVDRIFEIDQEQLLDFPGNYDDYVEKKSGWIEKKKTEFHRFEKKRKQLETMLAKARAGIIRSRSGNATKAVKSRINRELVKREVKQYRDEKLQDVSIAGQTHSSKLIARATNLGKSFGDKKVLENISFEIRGSEKIWLFGPNGVGKTTLVKCLIGELDSDIGEVIIGHNVRIGYFAQKQQPETSRQLLIDYFQEKTGVFHYEVISKLGRFLFDENDLRKPLYLLSPGQQARLKFALFAYGSQKDGGYQFLILDEPAHHLDIPTKEVIEQSLIDFKGAVLLISHDVYSVEQIDVDRVFRMDKGVFEIKKM